MNRLTSCWVLLLGMTAPMTFADDLHLSLRYQTETSKNSGRFHRLHRSETWKASETAVIICDVWDFHHCLNAVRRLEEFGPRLNKLLIEARSQGATIIHSPSDCMDAYGNHEARQRAIDTPAAKRQPKDVASWCSFIPSEERAKYPIDQSDGGEDDDPAEHAKWAAKLKAMGRNPGMPWNRQSDMIEIDAKRDFISDRGDEVWNILEHRGIKNVILTGVHTNMCVLGRPFGLRQMARNGKNVVLVRDMTDTMYNPKRWPYVSHFTGTDYIISHVEKYVCPTITSDQLLGGEPLRLKNDKRLHLAILMAEQNYHTNRNLPRFAERHLGHDFRVSYVFADDSSRNNLPGLDVLDDADAVLISVRRRVLPQKQLETVRRFIAAGKPVIGLRTANHAFVLNGQPAGEGLSDWPDFDREVFGCNYHGSWSKGTEASIVPVSSAKDHVILTGVNSKPFAPGYSIYKNKPLDKTANVVLSASVGDEKAEPIAWSFKRKDGGRSFYLGLGHSDDFKQTTFQRVLLNGIYWAVGLPLPMQAREDAGDYEQHWSNIEVPRDWKAGSKGAIKSAQQVGWYRCVVRLTADVVGSDDVVLSLPDGSTAAWFNGRQLDAGVIKRDWITVDDYDLLVVRVSNGVGLTKVPTLSFKKGVFELSGRWQLRMGDNKNWSNIPLPAKFGGSADVVFEPSFK